jgi:hypothetical protein
MTCVVFVRLHRIAGAPLRLQQVVNSSIVYLLSSIRDDYAMSVSPGGITTNRYVCACMHA